MADLLIRPADRPEFEHAIGWASGEGWNPGLDDLAAFHAADPEGFLIGFAGDEPVSSISVVRYGDGFGFLGFYIVHPDHRGTGKGLAIWNAGMARLEGRTIGLDGVIDQQDNYRRSGFELAGRNIRYSGIPQVVTEPAGQDVVRPVSSADLPAIILFDRQHFPADRAAFLSEWVLPSMSSVQRHSLVAYRADEISGYGTIRACRTGYKIGPLFAVNANAARALLSGLVGSVPRNAQVVIDVPQDNREAVAMAVRAGLQPVFETARMYRGRHPELALNQIFGLTTFELG